MIGKFLDLDPVGLVFRHRYFPSTFLSPGALYGGAGLVEQRRLLKDFHLTADAALRPAIGSVGVAPAVRAEIGLGLDERPRIGDDVQDALIETFGGDRLYQKFGHAGVARIGHAPFLG